MTKHERGAKLRLLAFSALAAFLIPVRPLSAEEVARNSMNTEKQVREPAVAGQFYPARASDLSTQIEDFLSRVPARERADHVLGIVSPHAGYIYSGQVAAYAYKLLASRQVSKVVVISPSHVEYFPFASVFGGKAYRTPLGEIPVDRELARRIASTSELIRISPRGHLQSNLPRQEHSLEVQLPFLQKVLGDFSLVPIVMGDQKWEICSDLGEAVGEVLKDPGVVVVASSDLSHFHNDSEARRLDQVFCNLLEEMDPRTLSSALAEKRCEACGGGPVVAAMIAARRAGAVAAQVLATANSGDVTGDRSNVVGYASAAFFASRGEGKSKEDEGAQLNPEEKDYLLRLARYEIAQELGITFPPPSPLASPRLQAKSGAFVTLKIGGNLRGCIGYIEAIKPLEQTVREMAKAAAFQDPRFPALSEEEFDRIDIEISVLSPLRQIEDPEQIRVGKHGLVIERGGQRGLLLPQVATEYHWNRREFLEHTCRKAMLPPGAWRERGTRIFVFSAVVFGEKEN